MAFIISQGHTPDWETAAQKRPVSHFAFDSAIKFCAEGHWPDWHKLALSLQSSGYKSIMVGSSWFIKVECRLCLSWCLLLDVEIKVYKYCTLPLISDHPFSQVTVLAYDRWWFVSGLQVVSSRSVLHWDYGLRQFSMVTYHTVRYHQ